jgi:hypothetical protein
MSYGSAGPDLDASKFEEYKEAHLKVDECYTTTDHALKYTLVHLEKRNRETAMRGFMTYVSLRYGIVPKEIYGYAILNGLGVSNDLYEYPGFRVLHQHMVECNPSFSLWVKKNDVRRGGVLKRYNDRLPVDEIGLEDRDKVVCIFVLC